VDVSILDKLKSNKTSAPITTGFSQKTFKYTAISDSGVRSTGQMRAPNVARVAEALSDDGWLPVTIKEITASGMNFDITAAVGGGDKKVKMELQETAEFFRQMSELLRAGVPLSSVLKSLGEETTDKRQQICEVLLDKVTGGTSLSEAMAEFPDAFDAVTRAYIASGEEAGRLPEAVMMLAQSLDKRNALRLKLKGVTAYPKFVGFAIIIIVLAILQFMVPTYVGMYEDFGSELPLVTRGLIAMSDNVFPLAFVSTFPDFYYGSTALETSFLGVLMRIVFAVGFVIGTEALRNFRGKDSKMMFTVAKWGMLVYFLGFTGNFALKWASFFLWGGVIGTFLAISIIKDSPKLGPKGVKRIDMIKFRMPVMGNLIRLNALFQWSATLSGALASGVSMSRALSLAADASGSRWHQQVAQELTDGVMAGRPLSEVMKEHKDLYPGNVRSMIATGEESGDLAPMLDNVSYTTENEIDAATATLSAKVEVLLLMVMGVIVGGILVALYLPVLQLAGTMDF